RDVSNSGPVPNSRLPPGRTRPIPPRRWPRVKENPPLLPACRALLPPPPRVCNNPGRTPLAPRGASQSGGAFLMTNLQAEPQRLARGPLLPVLGLTPLLVLPARIARANWQPPAAGPERPPSPAPTPAAVEPLADSLVALNQGFRQAYQRARAATLAQ